MAPFISSPMFSNDRFPPPQTQVMSAPDGNGTVPPSDTTMMDLPLDDFNFDAILNSQDSLSLPFDPPLPTPPVEPVRTCFGASHPDGLGTGTPCLAPAQPIASHPKPVQPLPSPVPNVYGDVPAMKDAILSLAQCMYTSTPGSYKTVVTGRSHDGNLVTAALMSVDPVSGIWAKISGGEEFFPTYIEAMSHLLVPLERQMTWRLYVNARQNAAGANPRW